MWVHRASRTHACMHACIVSSPVRQPAGTPRAHAAHHIIHCPARAPSSHAVLRSQLPARPACGPETAARRRSIDLFVAVCSAAWTGAVPPKVPCRRSPNERESSADAGRRPCRYRLRARACTLLHARSTCMVVADPIHGRMIERIDAAGAGRRDRLTGRIRGLDLDTEARSPHRARACRLALSTAVMTIKLLLHVLLRHTILSIYVLRSAALYL